MPTLEMMPPIRQKSWRWPAVANFVLGGTGSGLFLLAALFTCIDPAWMTNAQFVSPKILSPLIVCLGFFCVLVEAGRPSRGYWLLNRLSSSWMSIEGLFGGVFILSSIASFFFGSLFVLSIAVFSAVMLMISQGFMVANAVAVRAWSEKWVVVVFCVSGFMTAVGVVFLNTKSLLAYNPVMMIVALAIVMLNLITWLRYLFGEVENEYQDAVKPLRNPTSIVFTVGVGHILPFFLFCYIFAGYVDPFSWRSNALSIVSGLMLVAGGIGQKKGVIMTSGHYRRGVLTNLGD